MIGGVTAGGRGGGGGQGAANSLKMVCSSARSWGLRLR